MDKAMKDELDSINRNNTWRLTSLPPGHKAIGLKCVFKTKKDAAVKTIKHKARLVAKGYIQEHGIDFEEVFTPVARMETIRLLLAIAANNKWQVHHLDIKSAFLHGTYNEEAPRAWNIKLDNTLKSLDFKKCALEQAIYTRTERDSILLVGVYVDDLIITGTPKREIDKFKDQMKEIFEMSDLGLLAYYLGIEVTQSGGDISIKQSAYARKILKEAGMLESNETIIPMDPGTRLMKTAEGTMVNSTEYRSLIGCLRYLLHTRPDLSYSVGLLSRFMQEPKEQHMKAIKKVLRYVKGTKDYGITYKHNGGNKIYGYSDSSYGVNTQEGKGTTGIIFYYGESPISWSTQKQATVALSSCESEFIAATAAATQALWLKRLLSRLTHSDEEKITILVDNKLAIALIKNPVFHGRSKHIDTKYHFIKECVGRDDIQEAALDPFPETMTDADKTAALKTDVYKKAHSALLLCLDNKVLREVNKESSAAGVWLKLKTLYMTKSVAINLYLEVECCSPVSICIQTDPKETRKKSLAIVKNNVGQRVDRDYWCSFHMTPMRDILVDFKEVHGGYGYAAMIIEHCAIYG
ncbi:ribonuclease H-like domain, reverse transcriptase, RNA-dependent DNA polymerase [Tanacetum coccineum]